MNPTLREIVSAYLREHGYDGLYHEPSECACLLDDLMPCASGSGCPDLDGCRPGDRVEMEDGHWGVSPRYVCSKCGGTGCQCGGIGFTCGGCCPCGNNRTPRREARAPRREGAALDPNRAGVDLANRIGLDG